MLKLRGFLKSGKRAASQNMDKQLYYLSKYDLDISNCYSGTLNIWFENCLLDVRTWDHETDLIFWETWGILAYPQILRIKVEFPSKNIDPTTAWIYASPGSPWYNCYKMVEILTTKLSVECGDECTVIIDRPDISYRKIQVIGDPNQRSVYIIGCSTWQKE